VEETKKKRRIFYRWLLLGVILISVWLAGKYPPIQPHVQLPAEPLTPPLFNFAGQDFTITNTFVALVIADIIIILIAWSIYRQSKKGKNVLDGAANIFAMLIEAIYGMTETTAGKWTKKIFPIFATITLLLMVVNLMELIPGVDSIGFLHHSDHGYPVEEILPGVYTIYESDEAHAEDDHGEDTHDDDAAHADDAHTEEAAEDDHGEDHGAAADTHAEDGHGGAELYGIYPFVRVTSTDLSFTVALAIVAVFMVQVIGFQALGFGYTKKFFDWRPFWKSFKEPGCSGPLGMMIGLINTFFIGPLEFVAEISKIISFAFRLFGNIFAGAIVLFVIGSLVGPYGIQSVFLLLEFMVALIQAFVFGMLTMVFMSMATHAHGEEH
jgi:F-type H+-transporting ATPase subunit a